MPGDLEIVIPAYRAEFLCSLLESLCAQTCSRFKVLVVDDCSPDDIQSVCEPFRSRLSLNYRRFDDNLGKTDLAAHWNRCVAQSTGSWLMLPGDDDMLGSTCVEKFLEHLQEHGDRYDAYMLDLRVINEAGHLKARFPAIDIERPADLLLKRFAGRLKPHPVSFIFSRKVFEEHGGFVSFNRGWHTDDATFALFSARTGIKAMNGATASFRRTPTSLSGSTGPGIAVSNLRASIAFLAWMSKSIDRLKLSRSEWPALAHSLLWRCYNRSRGVALPTWLIHVAAWSAELQRCAPGSFSRHLWRFFRARFSPPRNDPRALRKQPNH